MLHQLRGCPNDYIQAIDPRFYCDACIVHVTPNVSEDFGLEPQIANDFAILARLLRGRRRSELDVFNSKSIQRFGYFDLGLRIEECIGKLQELG